MCLLLSIIIWLAEMLTLLRKIHFQFLAVFQDSAQREHTIATAYCYLKTVKSYIHAYVQ